MVNNNISGIFIPNICLVNNVFNLSKTIIFRKIVRFNIYIQFITIVSSVLLHLLGVIVKLSIELKKLFKSSATSRFCISELFSSIKVDGSHVNSKVEVMLLKSSSFRRKN